jgi:transposase
MTPEALDSLSKKELIDLVLAMAEQITALQARVAELEAKLSEPPKTPDNSSLPPSQGQKANLPQGKTKQRRKGRKGSTRRLAGNPDHTRDI